MRLVWGAVSRVEAQRPGLQRLEVSIDGEPAGTALNYPQLAGECGEGDAVLLNVTAVGLSLGTGGTHFVVARTAPGEIPGGVSLEDDPGGHIMKLRYTPLQRDVLAVEAPESPYHDSLVAADDIGGMPVVCCGLHSQVPLVAAALKQAVPAARIAYCMTDQAALPLALSDSVGACIAAGLLDVTVSCGQSFGGRIEAVTLHSGLIAARHVAEADVAVVAIGPGVVGTGTPFGHGGVAQGEAINAAAAVGGAPIAVLRLSSADRRARHRGVSHHTLTALGRVALAPADVAMPRLSGDLAAEVEAALTVAGVWRRHRRAEAAGEPLPDMRGVPASTMGRSPEDDPAFFAAAVAAGEVAAGHLGGIA